MVTGAWSDGIAAFEGVSMTEFLLGARRDRPDRWPLYRPPSEEPKVDSAGPAWDPLT